MSKEWPKYYSKKAPQIGHFSLVLIFPYFITGRSWRRSDISVRERCPLKDCRRGMLRRHFRQTQKVLPY